MKQGENHAAASLTDRRMRMEERDKQIRDKVDHRDDLCLEISLTIRAIFNYSNLTIIIFICAPIIFGTYWLAENL